MRSMMIWMAPVAALTATAAAAAQGTDNWRAVADRADEARMARIDASWRVGLAEARRADPRTLAALGKVVNRSLSLPRPHPAPGNYQCRTIKLGSQGAVPGLIAYGWMKCRVELSPGGDLKLVKVGGSQRQMGLLYPRDRRSLAFVGTLALGYTESGWPTYGSNPERNVVGVFERIGTNHYRLAMPEPRWESRLDLLELRR